MPQRIRQSPSSGALAFATNLTSQEYADLYLCAARADEAFAVSLASEIQAERKYILGRGLIHLLRQWWEWNTEAK
jgi:hypothetical protein